MRYLKTYEALQDFYKQRNTVYLIVDEDENWVLDSKPEGGCWDGCETGFNWRADEDTWVSLPIKENIEGENYIDYRERLQVNFYQPNLMVDELEDDEDELDESDFFEESEELLPGQGNTYPHNLNIFHGAGSLNPFKKEDPNHQIFEESDDYKMYNQSFMSPLRALEGLDTSIWQSANDQMHKIQESGVRDDVKEIAPFNNPWVDEDDHDLNWENAPDPFKGNDIETFDINANYNTIVESNVWRTWRSDEVFSWVLRRWSDVKRFAKGIRTFSEIGRAHV